MLNSTSAVITPVSNAPFYRAVGDEVQVFRPRPAEVCRCC